MRISLKEAWFKVALLICLISLIGCPIFPIYGMDDEKEGEATLPKGQNLQNQLKGDYSHITSFSSREHRIKRTKQEEQLESKRRKIAQSLIDPHVEEPHPLLLAVLRIKGAEQGNFSSLYNMGWFVRHQEGNNRVNLLFEQKNKNSKKEKLSYTSKAFYWWQRTENYDDPETCRELAKLYLKGESVRKNYSEALRLFQKAAQHNDAEGQKGMRVLSANGWGTKQDYGKAMEWFLKAAAQNHASAQYNVGVLYANGDGVKQDFSEALWRLNDPSI